MCTCYEDGDGSLVLCGSCYEGQARSEREAESAYERYYDALASASYRGSIEERMDREYEDMLAARSGR